MYINSHGDYLLWKHRSVSKAKRSIFLRLSYSNLCKDKNYLARINSVIFIFISTPALWFAYISSTEILRQRLYCNNMFCDLFPTGNFVSGKPSVTEPPTICHDFLSPASFMNIRATKSDKPNELKFEIVKQNKSL